MVERATRATRTNCRSTQGPHTPTGSRTGSAPVDTARDKPPAHFRSGQHRELHDLCLARDHARVVRRGAQESRSSSRSTGASSLRASEALPDARVSEYRPPRALREHFTRIGHTIVSGRVHSHVPEPGRAAPVCTRRGRCGIASVFPGGPGPTGPPGASAPEPAPGALCRHSRPRARAGPSPVPLSGGRGGPLAPMSPSAQASCCDGCLGATCRLWRNRLVAPVGDASLCRSAASGHADRR